MPEHDSDEAPPSPEPFSERASVAGAGVGTGVIVLAVLGGIAAVGVSWSRARRGKVP